MILFIRGQKFWNKPSPIEPVYEQAKLEFPDVRVEIIDHDEADVDISLFDPLSEAIALVGHSFGMDTCVEIAGDFYGRYGPSSGIYTPIHVVGLDGVKKREWWNPFRSEWKLPPNVYSARCFLRDDKELVWPFSSELDCSQNQPIPDVTYDYDEVKVNGDHVTMVKSCQQEVIEFLRTIFPGETNDNSVTTV